MGAVGGGASDPYPEPRVRAEPWPPPALEQDLTGCMDAALVCRVVRGPERPRRGREGLWGPLGGGAVVPVLTPG